MGKKHEGQVPSRRVNEKTIPSTRFRNVARDGQRWLPLAVACFDARLTVELLEQEGPIYSLPAHEPLLCCVAACQHWPVSAR